MLGDVQIAEPGALIGFAGPRVIEQTIREKLPEGFQRAEYLLDHGMLDRVTHRSELRERAGIGIMPPADAASRRGAGRAAAPADAVARSQACRPAAGAGRQPGPAPMTASPERRRRRLATAILERLMALHPKAIDLSLDRMRPHPRRARPPRARACRRWSTSPAPTARARPSP